MALTPLHDEYDLIILGGGSAGIVSGVMASGLGLRVLLIERHQMGGECLHTGCVPSKALLHAARVAHTIRTAAQIGLPQHEISRTEAAAALRHVRETIQDVETADATTQMLWEGGVEIEFGSGYFTGPHTFRLGDRTVSAASFILATGSRPIEPSIPGLNSGEYRTNKTIFDLEEIPETLIVVGGGPIGVEMAQAFTRLGSRVVLVQQGDRLLPHDDTEMARQLESYLRDDGVEIHLQTTLSEIRRTAAGRVAILRDSQQSWEAPFHQILFAMGRLPNTEGLALEAAGVEFNQKGIRVDSSLRTTAPHIYACGDLLGHDQFSHMAEYEAKIAVRNIYAPGHSSASFDLAPWTTFTEPELTHIGATEEQLQTRGTRYEVYRQPFAQNDRAITDHSTRGLIKVLTHGLTGRILGVHILGSHSGELAHEWIMAMQHGHSIRAVADMIHVYPTLSLVSQHAAQRWYERKAKAPPIAVLLNFYARTIRPRQTAIAWGVAGTVAGIGLGLFHHRDRSGP